jgi:hypothetical protein
MKLTKDDIRSLELLEKKGGFCIILETLSCDVCYFSRGCCPLPKERVKIARELLYNTVEYKADCRDKRVPKYEIGQMVRCKEHGMEFEIKNMCKRRTEFHYYKTEETERIFPRDMCGKEHYTGFSGVPESMLELVEKKFAKGGIVEESTTEFKFIGQAYIDKTKEEYEEIPIHVSSLEYKPEDYNFNVDFKFRTDCSSKDFLNLFIDTSKLEKTKLNKFQKLIKFFYRRYKMLDSIKELFPKTKDACLVEKYFYQQFSDELAIVNYKDKTDAVLELAKKKRDEEKEKNRG